MRFEIGGSFKPDRNCYFEYLKDEYSINYRCVKPDLFGGVLFNDLSLEIGVDGLVLYVSGLCPHTLWKERPLNLPQYTCRRVVVESDVLPKMGVYQRFNEDDRWQIYADTESKLLCVGDPEAVGNAVSFIGGSVLVFIKNVPVALWLYEVAGLEC